MNDDAIDRLNKLFSLEDNLRKFPEFKKLRQIVTDEIRTYEEDTTKVGGEDKPEPPPTTISREPPKQPQPKVQPRPMNEIPNDPANAPAAQPNRRG